jgi:hypothetical protein
MEDDPRCCGSGTCIIDEHGQCWCGQRWDGQKMTGPGACAPADEHPEDDGVDRATP